ncbi:MAG: hypothetical protein CSH37_01850 [Thalassolituus sp.]|jgi:hypothetical protein|uniref:Uncharacterized protein n=1 Tax=Thalassolituus maritimus TaxID=484498 RepID=A0ABQ0A0R3_9GAMM|nr:hypothetical protein [Pseudomonadota bacterium]MEC8104189.1 hypothetical protein [Pseudomonadota bacterium]MEC8523807.1 hypothetical protein [Pseudomonadota bacterium]TNC87103.1 MAG: hypothetical protein CSH37_01850 [Thalassolituus sp.]
MPIVYSEDKAIFESVVTIQEVDDLHEWLLAHPKGSIDLAACEHLHTAALQTLSSAGRTILAWPDVEELKQWIEPLLTTQENK